MYLEIDYEERNAGIRIWRCRGYGEVLKVPEMLEGKMVTELAPYALSSSRPAEEPDPSVIKHVVMKPEEKGFGEPSELCGKQLTGSIPSIKPSSDRGLCILFLQESESHSFSWKYRRGGWRSLHVVSGSGTDHLP